MKTDVEIRKDVYRYVKASPLAANLAGVVSWQGRSDKATTEDCIISILDNENGQIQGCYVNVNIYIQNINSGGRSVENTSRTGTLSKVSSDVLNSGYGDTFRFKLVKQRVLAVPGKDEYVINNKLKYKQFNP